MGKCGQRSGAESVGSFAGLLLQLTMQKIVDIVSYLYEQRRETPGGCWESTQERDIHHNYPRVWWRGERWRIHRLWWTLLYGPIPKNRSVRRRCGNPVCWNHEHLYLCEVLRGKLKYAANDDFVGDDEWLCYGHGSMSAGSSGDGADSGAGLRDAANDAATGSDDDRTAAGSDAGSIE